MDKRFKENQSDNKLALPARMEEIVRYFFDNPNLTYTELSKYFKVSLPRISQIMHHPRVLAAYPVLAKRSVTGMIPKSLKVYNHVLEQRENLYVAEKVASKILDSEKVLEPVEHKITHELGNKSIAELQEIIQKATLLPAIALDAEIVGEENV